MARLPLNEWEREQKKQFDKQLKTYSTDCLEQIYKIAMSAMNMDTRLKACIYILDRTIGKAYQVYKDEQNTDDTNININLVVENGESNLSNEAWNNNDSESDSDDEEWGTDIYKPDK